MSSSEAPRIPFKIQVHLEELGFGFDDRGHGTPWATAVYTTLRDFHSGLHQPENLRATDMDRPFRDFLRKHGGKLFGEKSNLRRLDEEIPTFSHLNSLLDSAEVFRTFDPIRKCFLYLSQELRRKQKNEKMKRTSWVRPTDPGIVDGSEAGVQTDNMNAPLPESDQDRDTRFPHFGKDDLIDDDHSIISKEVKNQQPWIIRYLPSDPHPSGLSVDRIYPVIRRVRREISDWYVHWDQDGHKTWLLLRYNSTHRFYCLFHQNGKVQRVDRETRGGVPKHFIPNLERQSNDNPDRQLGTVQKSNESTFEKSADLHEDNEFSNTISRHHDQCSPSKRAIFDNEDDESQLPAFKRVTRGLPQSPSRLFNESSSNPLTKAPEMRVASINGKADQPELRAVGRVSGELPSSPYRQVVERQTSHIQKIHTKISPQIVKVTPCILDDNSNWREWQYGKLSSLDVDSLFTCIAKSYDIDENSSFIEVEFHLMDLVPEEIAIVRRGDIDGFKKAMTRSGEGAIANRNRTCDTSFWVGLRPVVLIEALDI